MKAPFPWFGAKSRRDPDAVADAASEHDMPASWQKVAWKAAGGYGSQAAVTNENKHRERIWFSPHCRSNELQLTYEQKPE